MKSHGCHAAPCQDHARWRAFLPVLALLVACTSSSKTTSDAGSSVAMCSMPGAAVSGAADKHCGSNVQVTSAAACHPADSGAASAHDHMTVTDQDAGVAPEFGDTMYGSEGDDDDCKYHLSWTSTALCQGGDVYFTVQVTKKADGKPLTGADTMPDLSIGEAHPGITNKSLAVEATPGTYKVGPVRFDQPGKWTVRFHFYGECDDGEESPHGHAAFFVNVP